MIDRPTLFLLPGLLCDEAVWIEQKKALASFADVKIPIFRGFHSLKTMAESVLKQAPERFSVVGHSMGGRVAMELINMAGNRIDKFAVMDTGVHPVQPAEAEKRQELLDLANEQGLKAVADAWILPMIHASRHSDSKLIKSITDMILRNSVEDYNGQVKALLSRKDQSGYLADIKQHVLLICGETDSWSPLSRHREMQTRLKSSELVVVKGSGHMTTMEKPGKVSKILINWLSENDE